MAPRTQGRPPFRADHVGSLLRPPALRQAFRQFAAKEIGDASSLAFRTSAYAMSWRCRKRSDCRW